MPPALQDYNCHACNDRRKKTSRCSACGQAEYCGRECQRADWQAHRAVCKNGKAGRGLAEALGQVRNPFLAFRVDDYELAIPRWAVADYRRHVQVCVPPPRTT